jgi:phosphomannomutase
MVKSAVTSGLLSSGIDVTDFGVVPTPACMSSAKVGQLGLENIAYFRAQSSAS